MKAYASTIDLVGPARPKSKPASGGTLIEIRPRSVAFSAVAHLSDKLHVQPSSLLEVIGIPERTAARRRQEAFLKTDEADRLLRVARVLEEATRVFGSQEKAARWLSTTSPVLYSVTPLSLLESDAGSQAVTDELGRIDFGDFA